MGMRDGPAWAERSLLGALILSPSTCDVARSLVRAADFVDPWHGEVYSILIQDRALDLPGLGRRLRERLGPGRVDLPRLHGLVRDLPLTVDPGTLALAVVDGSLRRQVSRVALLVEGCRLVESTDGGRVGEIARVVRAVLAAVGLRNGQAVHGRLAGGESSVPAVNRVDEFLLQADRILAGVELPAAEMVQDTEVRLVGSLFAHPTRILPWAGHVRPEWLTAQEWAPVLSVLQRRAELGEALDVGSVCWEVHRTSRAAGPGPGVEAVSAAVQNSC